MRYVQMFLMIIAVLLPATTFAVIYECTNAPWYGKNCVSVEYQNEITSIEEANDKIREQQNTLENISKEAKLSIKLEGNNYSIYRNQKTANPWLLQGQLQYSLATPKEADRFDEILKDHHYQTVNFQEEICSH